MIQLKADSTKLCDLSCSWISFKNGQKNIGSEIWSFDFLKMRSNSVYKSKLMRKQSSKKSSASTNFSLMGSDAENTQIGFITTLLKKKKPEKK